MRERLAGDPILWRGLERLTLILATCFTAWLGYRLLDLGTRGPFTASFTVAGIKFSGTTPGILVLALAVCALGWAWRTGQARSWNATHREDGPERDGQELLPFSTKDHDPSSPHQRHEPRERRQRGGAEQASKTSSRVESQMRELNRRQLKLIDLLTSVQETLVIRGTSWNSRQEAYLLSTNA